jgi:hypothetical protein
MKKILVVLLFAVAVLAPGQESWFGLFMQNKKIGYSSSVTSEDRLDGVPMTRSDMHTVMRAVLLGTAMTMEISSSTWASHGKPKRMVFRIESSNRVQSLDARFGVSAIDVVVVNGGARTKTSLSLPTDGPVVDDSMSAAIVDGKATMPVQSFYVLDPLTISLVKNTVEAKGKVSVEVRGKTLEANRFDITEPRAVQKVYMDSKGTIVKADGPMGIEMIPMTKREALAAVDGSLTPDLADASSIRTDKDIPDPESVRDLKLRITGRDLSLLPSDEHQTVKKDGSSWIVEVHPVQIEKDADVAIPEAAKLHSEWTKPSMYIPADRPRFTELAKKIVGGAKTVRAATGKIRQFVHDQMRFNAGIGVLRDAGEVLNSKEGVCRDYAVLTTTLLRSAGIPSRVVGGVVYADGRFYYHAWSEAWDGAHWVGVDSTRPGPQITATHVKLADGNVDRAFMFTFLGDAQIHILKIAYADGTTIARGAAKQMVFVPAWTLGIPTPSQAGAAAAVSE